MECSHLKVACALIAHQLPDAAFHLCGGLVGECQGEDVPRFQLIVLEKPCDLIGEHTRLARPCAGNHQLRAVAIGHGLALVIVELVYDLLFCIHRMEDRVMVWRCAAPAIRIVPTPYYL